MTQLQESRSYSMTNVDKMNEECREDMVSLNNYFTYFSASAQSVGPP